MTRAFLGEHGFFLPSRILGRSLVVVCCRQLFANGTIKPL